MRSKFNLFIILLCTLMSLSSGALQAQQSAVTPNLPLALPNEKGSVKFLAVGDTGSGTSQQAELARLMSEYRKVFPYDFAIMMGDNIYGSEDAADMKKKFEDVYRPILDQGVKFYASLGNHDEASQRLYGLFNMDGKEYYRFKSGDAAFYALNSNYMDKRQVEWFKGEISKDDSRWKIAFFHHPPYSSGGKHGSSVGLREVVEPIFLQNGVSVVFTGHEHFYERLKPQNGIYYFVNGAGGKLRKGDVAKGSPLTAKAFDSDLSFMLVEITKDTMFFQTVSRAGAVVDSGGLPRRQ